MIKRLVIAYLRVTCSQLGATFDPWLVTTVSRRPPPQEIRLGPSVSMMWSRFLLARIVSLPPPPRIESPPGPPLSSSAPLPPTMLSYPESPLIESAPFCPNRQSD